MRKGIAPFAALSVLALVACTGPGWTPTVATEQEKSVVVLDFGDGGATATMIGNGLLLTAAHVVEDMPDGATMTTYDGKTFTAKAVWVSDSDDLAILQSTDEPAGETQDTELAVEPFLLGTTVYGIGHPHLDPRWVFTFGKVTSDKVSEYEGKHFVITDMKGAPGMSGGPVFGPDGQIAGIISIGYGGGMGLGITPLTPTALARIAALRNGG